MRPPPSTALTLARSWDIPHTRPPPGAAYCRCRPLPTTAGAPFPGLHPPLLNRSNLLMFEATSPSSAAASPAMADVVISPFATINVKSHIPMTLELRSSNYTKWSSFFHAMCGKFGLLKHIDGTPPPDPVDAAWAQNGCCVRTWLYSSVSESVLDFTMAPNQTAPAWGCHRKSLSGKQGSPLHLPESRIPHHDSGRSIC